MDIAFEKENWSREPLADISADTLVHPDWHALRARLQAGRQAWRLLEPAARGERASACGSFDPALARQLQGAASCKGAVNRNDSTNGNPGHDINGVVAGTSSTGDRGQK